ncbi:MAG: hypothetical protein HQM03_15890 [Magnetococcales bacterium]|nr:hypothetical protein [Magnetococcales bacterium]
MTDSTDLQTQEESLGTEERPSPAERLTILYNHYSGSFDHIRDRERERDRSFLIVIAFLGLQVALAEFPQQAVDVVQAMVSKRTTGIALPLPAVVSTVWCFLFILTLRYFQVSTTIERQYEYLHDLENRLSALAGDDEFIRREGHKYNERYPAFSKWAWRCYVLYLPIVFASIVIWLGVHEWPDGFPDITQVPLRIGFDWLFCLAIVYGIMLRIMAFLKRDRNNL